MNRKHRNPLSVDLENAPNSPARKASEQEQDSDAIYRLKNEVFDISFPRQTDSDSLDEVLNPPLKKDDAFASQFLLTPFELAVESQANRISKSLEKGERLSVGRMPARAVMLAKQLKERYASHGIDVGVLNTDKEYYSDEILDLTISTGKFFVSQESPDMTARNTDLRIREHTKRTELQAEQNKSRERTFIDRANERRKEKSAESYQSLLPKVTQFEAEYKAANNGKSPSLRKLADILNKAEVASPGGSPNWHPETVSRVLHPEKHQSRSK